MREIENIIIQERGYIIKKVITRVLVTRTKKECFYVEIRGFSKLRFNEFEEEFWKKQFSMEVGKIIDDLLMCCRLTKEDKAEYNELMLINDKMSNINSKKGLKNAEIKIGDKYRIEWVWTESGFKKSLYNIVADIFNKENEEKVKDQGETNN